jgi:hypothetical protein
MASLLNRYEQGELTAVWDEIRLGHADAQDAEAVAAATMQRVARNIDVIVEMLTDEGWRWAYPDLKRTSPTAADIEAIAELQQRAGPLPLALRTCLAEVGEVWPCGSLPSWPTPAFAFDGLPRYPALLDPLVLPSAAWIEQELAEWDSDQWVTPKRPWRFGFAPDELHKANISGSTHDIELPGQTADPVIYGISNREGITPVEYLRVSMTHGGFAGTEFLPVPPDLPDRIAEQLLPF